MTDHTNSIEPIRFSLTPIKSLIILLALGPLLGVYDSYIHDVSLIGLDASFSLLVNFSLYTLSIFIMVIMIRSDIQINVRRIGLPQLQRYINRATFLALSSLLIVYIVSGQYILSGVMDRGEVRIAVGLFGPFYTLTLIYILPLLSFVLLFYFFQYKALSNKTPKKLYLILFCIVLSAFLTGAKATLIFITLPLTCYFWANSSLKMKVILILFLVFFIVISNMLFGGNEGNYMDSLIYTYYRATSIAAYGVLGSWEFSNNMDYESLPLILNSIFGNHISSLMIDSSTQLFGDTGKLVTYQYYPAYERALAGTVNLTLTLFGDMYIFLGKYWFLGVGIFMLIVVYLFNKMKNKLKKGYIIEGGWIFIFLNMVILPIINSGGPFAMVSLPVIVYMIITYIILRFLLPKSRAYQ